MIQDPTIRTLYIYTTGWKNKNGITYATGTIKSIHKVARLAKGIAIQTKILYEFLDKHMVK